MLFFVVSILALTPILGHLALSQILAEDSIAIETFVAIWLPMRKIYVITLELFR